jgi:hypothetical protein
MTYTFYLSHQGHPIERFPAEESEVLLLLERVSEVLAPLSLCDV